MKKRIFNLDAILAPIPGENPAGDNLRYTTLYDEIKEARREEDPLLMEPSKGDAKKADWDKVIELSAEALIKKTKDLQLAAWLTEALIKTEGFSGLYNGLKIFSGFINDYWGHVYPLIEDGDLDFRIGPIDFLNEKLSSVIKQVPITDPANTPGYSWLTWQEADQVGYEADTRNQYGDVDDKKKKYRDELIADGKLKAEDFDAAVERTSTAYFKSLAETLSLCNEAFLAFDQALDNMFGKDAPRVAEIKEAIRDCEQLVKNLKQKKSPEPEPEPRQDERELAEEISAQDEAEPEPDVPADMSVDISADTSALPNQPPSVGLFSAGAQMDTESAEKIIWNTVLAELKASGIKKVLGQLYKASCSMPSAREKNRYRLLIAKICLKAERPDLARPIAEELFALIEELHLERWESPMWIAEVYKVLHQCLTSGNPSDDDMQRANQLFKKLCTIDITKAMF
jgi:type VI secretion system protein ImpA